MRALLAAPFLLLMVLFALSNPQPVKLGLWPTDYSVEAPLSLTVLVAMGAAFLIGSFMTWFGVFGARRRALAGDADHHDAVVDLGRKHSEPGP